MDMGHLFFHFRRRRPKGQKRFELNPKAQKPKTAAYPLSPLEKKRLSALFPAGRPLAPPPPPPLCTHSAVGRSSSSSATAALYLHGDWPSLPFPLYISCAPTTPSQGSRSGKKRSGRHGRIAPLPGFREATRPELEEWYAALADLYQLTLKLDQVLALAVVQVQLTRSIPSYPPSCLFLYQIDCWPFFFSVADRSMRHGHGLGAKHQGAPVGDEEGTRICHRNKDRASN